MITHNATAARFLYRSLMVGPTVELFILDCRDGYLGTQQAAWLKESLERSVATWKVYCRNQERCCIDFNAYFVL